ncbi:MAG: class II aldolase/adducin family protein [Myxococcota bacterium]
MSAASLSPAEELEGVKRAVLDTVQRMDRIGLTTGTAGNVSARTRAGEVVLTPTAMAYAEMKLSDLAVVDLDGNALPESGAAPPTTELDLHLACLRRHPDIGAVVHTHPIFATMFAVNQTPIPCVIEEFEFYVGGDVPVAAYHRTGTADLGEGVAELLSDRAAALMANHGLVVVAGDPGEALELTQLVERAAQIIHGARLMGTPHPLPAMIREEFSAAYLKRRRNAAP